VKKIRWDVRTVEPFDKLCKIVIGQQLNKFQNADMAIFGSRKLTDIVKNVR